MKTLKSPFEINWPLGLLKDCPQNFKNREKIYSHHFGNQNLMFLGYHLIFIKAQFKNRKGENMTMSFMDGPHRYLFLDPLLENCIVIFKKLDIH
jgi:hypothetical protein